MSTKTCILVTKEIYHFIIYIVVQNKYNKSCFNNYLVLWTQFFKVRVVHKLVYNTSNNFTDCASRTDNLLEIVAAC